MIRVASIALLSTALFACHAQTPAPDLNGVGGIHVPLVELDEEQDEWMHAHCTYRGLSDGVVGKATAAVSAPDANLGEVVYVEGNAAQIAVFACRERPPFYAGEIVLRGPPPPAPSDSVSPPLVAKGEATNLTRPNEQQTSGIAAAPAPTMGSQNEKPAHDHTSLSPKRPALGYVLVGVGAAGLVAGGVAGYLALSHAHDVDSACNSDRVCTSAGLDAASSGRTAATASTWLVAGGAAALTTGVVILLFGGSTAKQPATTGGLQPVPGGGLLELQGAF
jgi:hypothetical protein